MTETYRIDEAERRVVLSCDGYFGDGFCVHFDRLEAVTSRQIVEGYGWWHCIRADRRPYYAVARDELLDRGLIEDRT